MQLRLTFIIALAVMIFLAGCSGDNNNQLPPVSGKAFIGGSEGLSLQFMSNAPPPEVFDNSDSVFDVSLRIENAGESDVLAGNAKITLMGIQPSQFNFGTASNPSTKGIPDDLYGIKLDPQQNTLPGGIMTLDWYGLYWTGDELTGNVPLSITASLCYQYETKAIGKLCLKQNLLAKPSEQDVCEVTRSIIPESSGAPIRVSELSQSAVGKSKLSFTFKIQHVGTGEVFTTEGGPAICDDQQFSNQNKIKVTVGSMADVATISCPSLAANGGTDTSGYVKLFDDSAIISCTAEFSDGAVTSNFERPLDVTVEYNYRQIESTPLLIKHVQRD